MYMYTHTYTYIYISVTILPELSINNYWLELKHVTGFPYLSPSSVSYFSNVFVKIDDSLIIKHR